MILIKPLITEKTAKMIELENKLTFIVARKSTKEEIKKEFESIFDTQVRTINTQIRKNQKIAFIKLKAENAAVNIATKLGVM
ncbi:MAG: 50S ribosomal protein L23 [Candidatus Pacearchaeota archaeon]